MTITEKEEMVSMDSEIIAELDYDNFYSAKPISKKKRNRNRKQKSERSAVPEPEVD